MDGLIELLVLLRILYILLLLNYEECSMLLILHQTKKKKFKMKNEYIKIKANKYHNI